MKIHLFLTFEYFDENKPYELRELKPHWEKLKTLSKGDIVVLHRGYSDKIRIETLDNLEIKQGTEINHKFINKNKKYLVLNFKRWNQIKDTQE